MRILYYVCEHLINYHVSEYSLALPDCPETQTVTASRASPRFLTSPRCSRITHSVYWSFGNQFPGLITQPRKFIPDRYNCFHTVLRQSARRIVNDWTDRPLVYPNAGSSCIYGVRMQCAPSDSSHCRCPVSPLFGCKRIRRVARVIYITICFSGQAALMFPLAHPCNLYYITSINLFSLLRNHPDPDQVKRQLAWHLAPKELDPLWPRIA